MLGWIQGTETLVSAGAWPRWPSEHPPPNCSALPHQNLKSSLSFQPLGRSLRMVLFSFTILMYRFGMCNSHFFFMCLWMCCAFICICIFLCVEDECMFMCVWGICHLYEQACGDPTSTLGVSLNCCVLFMEAESFSQIQNFSIWLLFSLFTLGIPSPPSEAGIYKRTNTPTQCFYTDPKDPNSHTFAASTLMANCSC